MNDLPIDALIDEIASAVVFADTDDKETVDALASLFDKLAKSCEQLECGQTLALIHDCIARLPAVTGEDLEEAQANLETISKKITELQALRKLPADAESSKKDDKAEPTSEPSSEEDDQFQCEGFELPAHIEEDTFREFITKQKDVLEDIESDILAIEKGKWGRKAELKRKIHTMKGEAGLIGLVDLERVCHAIEDLMESCETPSDCVDQFLIIKDWMASATEAYANKSLPVPSGDEVIARVLAFLSNNDDKEELESSETPTAEYCPIDEDDTCSSPTQTENASGDTNGDIVERDQYTIELCADFIQESEEGLNQVDGILINVEEDGATPELINTLFRVFHTIKGLSGFLEFKTITMLAHTTETLLNVVRDGRIELADTILDLVFDATALIRKMITAVREAVEASSTYPNIPEFEPMLERLKLAIQGGEVAAEELPQVEPGRRLGEILTQAPISIAAAAIEQALEEQKKSGRKLGEELITQGIAKPKQVAQALRAQKQANQRDGGAAKIRETIKVDLERVDSLVEMIGELIIVESMVVNSNEITAISSPTVRNYMAQLDKITRDLQAVSMRMRMVPVRGVFQKMTRMVRDLSRKSGKRVRMITNGEATEMDRSMVEQIADPLVHMIRNSVDHGIETEKERIKLGKDPVGTVNLFAYHEGGSIVIEIVDDGKGLSREAILSKAREKGLIKEGQNYSDHEVFNLIFTPGFSTAKQVTDISGRGVGMDVVKKNIDGMRGRISISSEPGNGTSFKIILPLTLAIIEGMLVASGDEKYIIPTLSIIESIQPDMSMIVTFSEKAELLNVRGETIPLIRLDRLFGVSGAKQNLSDGLVVIVEGVGHRIGLFVDDVLNQQQVVIKTMGEGLKKVEFVAGAAILSDGRVGLILNIDELSTVLERSELQLAQRIASNDSNSALIGAETINMPCQEKGNQTGAMEGVQ